MIYSNIAAKVIKFFGREIITGDELSKWGEDVPDWVYSYCQIAENEYYFGEDFNYERYKSYTTTELKTVLKQVMSNYHKMEITFDEARKLKLPSWVFKERWSGHNMVNLSPKYTPRYPTSNEEAENEMMEFITEEPETGDVDILHELDLLDIEVAEPVEETMPIGDISTPNYNEESACAITGFDDETINKMANAFAEAFAQREPITSVPPRPVNFYVPQVDKLFIKWGIYSDVELIVSRNMFYPVFITGLSGNGKTMTIEQVCANLKRELLTINITQETDEDDLLGGYRLIDGNTVWQDGPVIIAMKRGCPLLLDEVDYGSSKLSCLQSVLSGKSVLIKKTGEVVYPKPGFTVFATANTKGKGDDTGQFAGANILNEAFLDRFPIMLHNPYPSKSVEVKIFEMALKHYRFVYDSGKELTDEDRNFCQRMVQWCETIRKSNEEGATDSVISTRRGVDIMKSYVIFNSRERAISLGVERFNDDTRAAFAKLYAAIDEQFKRSSKPNSDGGKSARQMAAAPDDGTLGKEWQPQNSANNALNSF